MVAGFVLHRLVLVAEDEEVYRRIELRLLLGVLVETGVGNVVVIAALHLVFEFFQAVVVRPTQGQTNAQIRVQPLEQPLVRLELEHFFQELVATVAGTSAVAVDQKELLAFDGLDDRFTMQFNAQFVMQIAKTPQIVVADEQMDGNARIGELGQLALQSHKTFGNHGLVFKPKVEKITHQVEFLAVGTNHVQKTQEFPFALVAALKRGDAQMEVGDEIDGHQNLISALRRISSVMRVMSFGSTACTALMTSSWVMLTGWSSP